MFAGVGATALVVGSSPLAAAGHGAAIASVQVTLLLPRFGHAAGARASCFFLACLSEALKTCRACVAGASVAVFRAKNICSLLGCMGW